MSFDKGTNTKYDFNDLLIQPQVQTSITSRKEVNPYDEHGNLPIFTAPMDTVVDEGNHKLFWENKINICFPRQQDNRVSHIFQFFYSLSLDEFIDRYINKTIFWSPGISATHDGPHQNTEFVLIDMANGHMSKMTEAIKKAKEKHGDNIFIMAGNVAHPMTYRKLAEAGVDAVRVGIGNGNGCLTTQQTGVGFPMASLIRDCYHQSLTLLDKKPLIIADGGMKNYSDIIKAIALGADYVMVGSLLNKCLESCGETRFLKYIKLNPKSKLTHWLHNNGFKLTKRFRGMSTKEVQKNWGNEKIKTSEGVVRIRPVEYTLSQWSQNFEDYLRSAMSYTNCRTLEEFRGHVKLNLISEQSYQRFNK